MFSPFNVRIYTVNRHINVFNVSIDGCTKLFFWVYIMVKKVPMLEMAGALSWKSGDLQSYLKPAAMGVQCDHSSILISSDSIKCARQYRLYSVCVPAAYIVARLNGFRSPVGQVLCEGSFIISHSLNHYLIHCESSDNCRIFCDNCRVPF